MVAAEEVAEGVDREAMTSQLVLEPPGQRYSVSARGSLENMNARRVCVCVCVCASHGWARCVRTSALVIQLHTSPLVFQIGARGWLARAACSRGVSAEGVEREAMARQLVREPPGQACLLQVMRPSTPACSRTAWSGVQRAPCSVKGAGCRVQGAGCRVQGAGCRVQGTGHFTI